MTAKTRIVAAMKKKEIGRSGNNRANLPLVEREQKGSIRLVLITLFVRECPTLVGVYLVMLMLSVCFRTARGSRWRKRLRGSLRWVMEEGSSRYHRVVPLPRNTYDKSEGVYQIVEVIDREKMKVSNIGHS
ncbi:MAG: hypothetical protein QGI31_02840 [Dehalococcoidia bacterium]|jgi:hypothetical protein|nr:hypothetical protein [Dehalococcoidia bacterium]